MKEWLAQIAIAVAIRAARWAHENPCHRLAERYRRELAEIDRRKEGGQ